MKLTKLLSGLGVCASVLALTFSAAGAALTTTVNGLGNASGFGESAQATISVSGSTFTVHLINNGTVASDPQQVLTAIFFTLPTGVSLAPGSATAPSGWAEGAPVNNVGEGWAYAGGVSVSGRSSAISAAGFSIVGMPTFGNFFTPGVHVDGLDYGIANGLLNPNGGITGNPPIVNREVDFSLTLSGPSLTQAQLNTLGSGLFFQWGTALSEGSSLPPQSIPDGGTTVLLLGTALSGLALIRRKLS